MACRRPAICPKHPAGIPRRSRDGLLRIRLAHFGSGQDEAFSAAVLQGLQLLLNLNAVQDKPDIPGIPVLSAAAGDPFGQFGKNGVSLTTAPYFFDHEGNLSEA